MTDTKEIEVTVDRPMGYDHNGLIYQVNYGYVCGIMGGDGEWQDAYIIDDSVNGPVKSYRGKLIAVVVRDDDNETKWIIGREKLPVEYIANKINFVEKFFKSHIIPAENYIKEEYK